MKNRCWDRRANERGKRFPSLYNHFISYEWDVLQEKRNFLTFLIFLIFAKKRKIIDDEINLSDGKPIGHFELF